MNHRARRWMLAAAIVVAAMALACGVCTPAQPYDLVRRHFEDDCGGDPLCGFVVVAGRAARVTAFTAGEHALGIDAGGAVELGFYALSYGTEDHVMFLARCDQGAALRLTESAGGQLLVAAGPPFAIGTAWQPASQVLPARTTLQTAVTLRFEVAGAGSCQLDELLDTTTIPPACPPNP